MSFPLNISSLQSSNLACGCSVSAKPPTAVTLHTQFLERRLQQWDGGGVSYMDDTELQTRAFLISEMFP